MRAPLKLMPRLSRDKLARLREIERDFHVRAFGEELARINLDMTEKERLDYIDWMRENARRHGVPPQPSHSVAWMLKLEEETDRESKG